MIKKALAILRRYPAKKVGRAIFHDLEGDDRLFTWNWESAV
jgi:hypothetical protein